MAQAGFKYGSFIRVNTKNSRLTGEFQGVVGSKVLLSSGITPRSLPLSEIDSVWIGRTQVRRGVIVGAAVGATSLGLLFRAYQIGVTDGPTNGLAGLAIGLVVGSVVGGTVGMAVGQSARRWVRIYP